MNPRPAGTVRWKIVNAGHYRNPETGVELKFGKDTGDGGGPTTTAWWIYLPQPGTTMTLSPILWELTFREARTAAVDLVESMKCAMSDPSFAHTWQPWHDHLNDLYTDRAQPGSAS